MIRNGTALTTMDGGYGARSAIAGRAETAFTTQLLAMRLDSPTFRQRRRIEPALGVAAYRDRLDRLPTQPASATQA